MSVRAVRRHCQPLMARAQAGQARHFTWHPERMALVAAYVTSQIRERYPDLRVRPHGVWRRFEAHDIDRWGAVAQAHGLASGPCRLERARAQVDLAFTAALLGAHVLSQWHYRDAASGHTLMGSEAISVASLRWWSGGALSSDPHQPCRTDAVALERLLTPDLAMALQVGPDNPLPGLEARANVLRQLALALRAHADLFSRPDEPGLLRPGHLVDALFRRCPTGQLAAADLHDLLLYALGTVWPQETQRAGALMGDCWPHPDAPDGWVPFHQVSQWLTYSLLEPLAEVGLTLTGLDELTGLPDTRQGGLLLDLGLLQARDRAFHTTRWRPGDEPVVEWRALTVVIMDHLAEAVRGELGLSPEQFPLARVLEGGSWAAGRRIALAKRPGGPPPVLLDSDGTLF